MHNLSTLTFPFFSKKDATVHPWIPPPITSQSYKKFHPLTNRNDFDLNSTKYFWLNQVFLKIIYKAIFFGIESQNFYKRLLLRYFN